MTALVTRYATAQVVLHWLTLLLLIASFVSHEWMQAAWEIVTSDAAGAYTPDVGVRVHTLVGVSILVLTVIRLILRVKLGAPPPVEGQARLLTIASASVHGLLYLLLLAIPLSGMAAWGGGVEVMADVHGVLFIVALVLVAVHVAAAVFHQVVIKDNVLSRMTLRR